MSFRWISCLLVSLATVFIVSSCLATPKDKPVAAPLKIIREAAKAIPSLAAVIIEHRGEKICEEYFNGATASTEFDVKSVTKSFVSAIAGAAKLRGRLPDLNTPFLKVMPEYNLPKSERTAYLVRRIGR